MDVRAELKSASRWYRTKGRCRGNNPGLTPTSPRCKTLASRKDSHHSLNSLVFADFRWTSLETPSVSMSLSLSFCPTSEAMPSMRNTQACRMKDSGII